MTDNKDTRKKKRKRYPKKEEQPKRFVLEVHDSSLIGKAKIGK